MISRTDDETAEPTARAPTRFHRLNAATTNGAATESAAIDRRAVFRRLLLEAKPYYGRLVLSLIFGIVAGLGPLSLTYALPLIFARVIVSPQHDLTLMWEVVVGLFLVNVVSNVAGYGQSYLTAWSGQRMVANLRVRLFDRILHLPLREFDRWRPGDFLARFTSDLSLITDAASTSLPQMVQTLVTLIGALAVMINTDWVLTLFLFLFAPVVNFAIVRFTKLISEHTQRAQQRVSDLAVNLTEVVQGQRIVKAFRREEYEIARFGDASEGYFGAYMKLTQLGQTQTPVVAMIILVALLVIVVFSVHEVIVGRIDSELVYRFWSAVALAINPINSFSKYTADIARGVVGANRIFEVLDLEPERPDAPDAIELPRVEGEIRFDHVDFAYDPAGARVLHDLDITIAAGEIVALVGPSGAGKTTIANLVPRFYEPQSGRVMLDGVALERLRLAQIRDAIAIVPQEAMLFSGSVADNIRYGRLDATQAEIEAAAREANAEEFILDLPLGYATRVGERGLRLSGGQRQRISIARAVLRDPRILILDEATSALDSHSERLIEAALDRLLPGRTTLIIAHRLSTIRRAHTILYVEAGRIVERGSHEALLSAGGEYARLHAAQFAL